MTPINASTPMPWDGEGGHRIYAAADRVYDVVPEEWDAYARVLRYGSLEGEPNVHLIVALGQAPPGGVPAEIYFEALETFSRALKEEGVAVNSTVGWVSEAAEDLGVVPRRAAA